MASRNIVCLFILCAFFAISCNTTNRVAYFENVKDAAYKSTLALVEAPIQKNDILSISISSLNEEASAIFNPASNKVDKVASSTGMDVLTGGYLVNNDGTIQLPILGNVVAEGLTKKQLKESITNTILAKKLLVDPVVDIRHLNFEITVIGEVQKPTVITVPSEKISLIKALGLAGDLTIYGKRENVLVIREIEGQRITRHINLNSPDFLNSPYYYLHPDDVVYVEPNRTRIASASRSQQLVPIILSSLSIMVVVISSLIKK
ncbi:MAG: polysaccharide biosynthesis/export family protein [Ferruginibacter sp.]